VRADFNPAWIVMNREMRDQLRDWRIVLPIIILTLFFPFLMTFTARQILDFVANYGANLLAARFIPFLLMIVGFFPITISLVIALESFAGESERHSIEPLLSTPLRDWQLYLGKLLASWIPPLAASYLGVLVYLFAIYNSTSWRAEPMFLAQVLLLNAVQALVMVSGAVVISTQTTSVRAANLLASFIIIPMALLIQAESVIMLWANYRILWWILLAEVLVAAMLIRMGIVHFNREYLLGRELDAINLGWAWSSFRAAFLGQVRQPLEWLRREVGQALRCHLLPTGLMFLLLMLGMWGGSLLVKQMGISPEALDLETLRDLDSTYLGQLEGLGFFTVGGTLQIWLHNLQVVLISSLLGLISFGVLGAIILIAPLTMIGFFAGLAGQSGLSPWIFTAAFTFPHALLEIPAIALAGAAIIRLGAIFITPNPAQSIGQAWIKGLADWAKLMIFIVIPLFLGAAFLEAFLTPRFAVFALGGL